MNKKLVTDKQLEAVAKAYAKLQPSFIPALVAMGHFKNGWNSAEAYYLRTHPNRDKRTKKKKAGK